VSGNSAVSLNRIWRSSCWWAWWLQACCCCKEADQRSGSREFHTDRTTVEKAHDGKQKAMACFHNRKTDNNQSCQVRW